MGRKASLAGAAARPPLRKVLGALKEAGAAYIPVMLGGVVPGGDVRWRDWGKKR